MEWMEVSHEDRCYWGDDIYGHPDDPDALLLPDAKRSVSHSFTTDFVSQKSLAERFDYFGS